MSQKQKLISIKAKKVDYQTSSHFSILLPIKYCYQLLYKLTGTPEVGQGGKPINGQSGGTSLGNVLEACSLDWLKMIFRMFQLTETMFF